MYVEVMLSTLNDIKGEFVTIDELENSGQKIAAYEKQIKDAENGIYYFEDRIE